MIALTSSAGMTMLFPADSEARADAVGNDMEFDVVLSELSVSGAGPETATGPVAGYRSARSGTATRTDTMIRDTPQGIDVMLREVLTD